MQTGRDTHAYVYFDGALAAAPATDPVWDPSVFAGVWHMESDAQQNAPEAVASNTALAQAADIPGAMPGMAGGARSYDGSTLVAADAAAYHFADDHSFAYALWIDAARANTEFDIPFHKGGSSSGSHGFDMELGYNAWNLSIVDDDGMVTEYPVGDASLVGAWHQLAGVIDREQAEVYGYLDGAPAAAQPKSFHGAAFLTGTDEPVRIGRTDYPVTGLVDEVRIYATAPTADWFAAEYANLAHRDTFVSFGAPEPF